MKSQKTGCTLYFNYDESVCDNSKDMQLQQKGFSIRFGRKNVPSSLFWIAVHSITWFLVERLEYMKSVTTNVKLPSKDQMILLFSTV
jgi:hypothetical protein